MRVELPKHRLTGLVFALGIAACVGCGDSGSATESDSAGTVAPVTTGNPGPDMTTADAGSGTMTGNLPTTGGSVSGTGSSSTGDSATATAGMTGDTTAASATTSQIDSDSAGTTATSTTDGPKLDMGDPCGGGVVVPDKGFLWAANSSEGTISKIDTDTVTEVGRYIVRPDQLGSPSRTSVSISGHVAVANRSGGVTKIYSDQSFCQESNGQPGIQTSTNNQYLPWGQDECVAWYAPFPYQSQRPVAWGPGVLNPATCAYENEELWTAGRGGIAGIDILVLDGNDGATKEKINVSTGPGGLTEDGYGIYGGAVDPDGNFWGSQLSSTGKLIRVTREDMSYQIWDTPAGPHWYGMSVDSDGIVWLCSSTVGRFDPLTETWQTAEVGGYTGCMADTGADGLLWMSNGQGVIGINRQTLAVEKTWNAAGSYGISIDFKGYIWAVAYGTTASKIDPNTGEFWTYNGLVGAYTYSDMTGFSLQANVLPQ